MGEGNKMTKGDKDPASYFLYEIIDFICVHVGESFFAS